MPVQQSQTYPLELPPGMKDFSFHHGDVVNRLNATPFAQSRSSMLDTPVVAAHSENELIAHCLSAMNDQGVEFGDLRLGVDFDRVLITRNEHLARSQLRRSQGIGVRVVVEGAWGFAATAELTFVGIDQAVKSAVRMAKAAAGAFEQTGPTLKETFAGEPAHQGEYHTPVVLCPLQAAAEQVTDPLIQAAKIGLQVSGIKRCDGFVMMHGERRRIASTEGLDILKTHLVLDGSLKFIAVKDGVAAYRTLVSPAMAGGYEHLLDADFPGQAAKAAAEAVLKCTARTPDPRHYDLILDPHNLALTMHESVGHPTELDRVLWYEWGMAGGSFADLGKKDHFQYGSPIVNFTANNTMQFGGASVGYDDEGVACQNFPIIKDGILVGYGTNRETAHAIGLERSNGTCRAASWAEAPIVRIPNLYLEPGKDPLSLDDLIADTKDGILLLGRDSFSIDQMRYNFQFGSDMAYRVENGKVTEPLRDVIYQSISPEFWNSCDAICDQSAWEIHGVFNCGKGQPIQIAKMAHGASPARFRKIKVGF